MLLFMMRSIRLSLQNLRDMTIWTDESEITVLTTEKEIVDSLMEGQNGTIFVEETPFYATMGGQEGDIGVIYNCTTVSS